MLNDVLNHEMFCGVGPFIHKILHKGWRTSQRTRTSYEDYFQDFVVLWLKRRGNFDPTRGKMTTFASIVATNYVRAVIKRTDRKEGRLTQTNGSLGEYDVSGPYAEFTADEMRLIEAYENQETKRVIGLQRRLCQSTEMSRLDLMETAEAIRTKVEMRRKQPVVFLA